MRSPSSTVVGPSRRSTGRPRQRRAGSAAWASCAEVRCRVGPVASSRRVSGSASRRARTVGRSRRVRVVVRRRTTSASGRTSLAACSAGGSACRVAPRRARGSLSASSAFALDDTKPAMSSGRRPSRPSTTSAALRVSAGRSSPGVMALSSRVVRASVRRKAVEGRVEVAAAAEQAIAGELDRPLRLAQRARAEVRDDRREVLGEADPPRVDLPAVGQGAAAGVAEVDVEDPAAGGGLDPQRHRGVAPGRVDVEAEARPSAGAPRATCSRRRRRGAPRCAPRCRCARTARRRAASR